MRVRGSLIRVWIEPECCAGPPLVSLGSLAVCSVVPLPGRGPSFVRRIAFYAAGAFAPFLFRERPFLMWLNAFLYGRWSLTSLPEGGQGPLVGT